MKIHFAIATLLVAICSSAFALDGDEALFGLRWGMTPAQVQAFGVTLINTENDRGLDLYKTTSLPKNVSDAESYSLTFFNGRLVKLWVVTKNITGDPTGAKGKERFGAFRSALAAKYGESAHNRQISGVALYTEWDEFYQCLAYSGCGIWASIFETNDKIVGIEIKGLRRGTGYIEITAEAKPQFHEALQVYRNRQKTTDKDAL